MDEDGADPGESPAQLIQDFRRRLRELRTEVRRPDKPEPTGAELIAALTGTGLRMSPTTLSEFASDKRPLVLPQKSFVEAYVTACLRYRGDSAEEIRRQVYSWLNSRTGIGLALDTSISAPAPLEIQPVVVEAELVEPSATFAPVTTPAAAERLWWQRPWVLLVAAVLLVALTVGATKLVTIKAVPHDPAQLSIPLGRPDPTEPDDTGCSNRSGTLRNSLDAPMGTAFLEECEHELHLIWTDHLADGYCTYVVIEWPDGSKDTFDRACPAGEIERVTVPKRATDYVATLNAINVEKKTPN